MAGHPSIDAWNNFVMKSDPCAYEVGSDKRSAAIAARYMALANNGGICSFLDASNDLDAAEVIESLVAVGALTAAREFGHIVRVLGGSIPRASQSERWRLLANRWQKSLDGFDLLSSQADQDLMQALRRHVCQNEAFYASLGSGE